MRLRYHRGITTQALGTQVSAVALETIIAANFAQDALRYQVGHDHFHFDNNSFTAAEAYVAAQHRHISEAIAGGEALPAWQAFGRLAHAVQDFYAHTNYVSLWREREPAAQAGQIEPLAADVMADPRLHSGQLYYPLELLSFIPAILPLVTPFLPRNSHAWMNKDDPSRPDFDFAFEAAVKRTQLEFQDIVGALSPARAELFRGEGKEVDW